MRAWCQLVLALSSGAGGGDSALSQQFRGLQEQVTTFVSVLGNFWCLLLSESSQSGLFGCTT